MPDVFIDAPITDILRHGTKKLLAQTLEAKIKIFINQSKVLADELGRQKIGRVICPSVTFNRALTTCPLKDHTQPA